MADGLSPQPQTAEPERPPGPWSAFTITVVILAGIMVPTLIWERPREIGRWKLAQAFSARERNDHELAYSLVADASARDPLNPSILLLRAQWRLSDKDFAAALADLTTAVELRPEDPELRLRRSSVYLERREYAAAVADLELAVSLTPAANTAQRIQVLNASAYARAIGEIDVDEGLREIDEAFKIIESVAKPMRAGELDTRGFLRYRRGEYQAALADLDAAVEEAEKYLTELRAAKPESKRRFSDPRTFEQVIEVYARNTAVLRYHRALIHEALNQREAAQKDRDRVRELGHEPGVELY